MKVKVKIEDVVENLLDRVAALEDAAGQNNDMSLKGAHNILDSYDIPSGAIHDRVFALSKLIKE
ncbi:hypothetical protein [uncultured Paraglaciecola sp.]|uniref:hypothetical protein n=1 Tax=uncultured Paraglaciecola sp. TaxID=1765024 RepID=UPI00261388D1|nr:hypothetical protein [uncultured Paraglaciecola sp.]